MSASEYDMNHSETVSEIQSLLGELARREAIDIQLPEPEEVTAEDLELLRSLGYVE